MQGGVWPLEELRAVIASVDFDRLVLDGIAAANGVPAVVVDVGDDPADDVGAALGALPAVSVAVGAGGESWDLALADPGPALEGLRANPQASVVAAQTLRRGAGLGLHDGLLVESLAYATLQAGPEHARWLAQRGRRTRRDADQPRIEVTEDGAVVTVTLNRPRLLNLFDAAMRDQLVDVLKALKAGGDGRPMVLTGAGGNFCAGGDPAEFGTVSDPVVAHLIRSRANAAPWLAAVADRTTARVDGACVGAGVELTAFCATVAATDRARFRLPELSMGLIPGAGGTVSIPARIGRQRTLEWMLTDAEVDAPTALGWGLVDRLV
ncbi:MAG: enoyl-CoA hydratase/isomerase family protein [Acidimicrobiaceae bacterium]|nr:enoyl-CoA hydratase/isomerase family protein [Acidimicrobiaceae bacterium]